eukprot:gene13562-21215_t
MNLNSGGTGNAEQEQGFWFLTLVADDFPSSPKVFREPPQGHMIPQDDTLGNPYEPHADVQH